VKPSASIVVSGFGVRKASWDRLRSCLDAIVRQEVPVEVVLVDAARLTGQLPEDVRDILPGLKVVACSNLDPWARKTAGVQGAGAPVVAFVDADCLPQPGWLQAMLEAFQYYPEVAVVRGQREVGWPRRWFPMQREAGRVYSTAATNVAFRREAYLDCPFPEGSGSRAVALQSEAMGRAGYVLWAEPAMQVMRDRRGLKQAAGVRADYSTATR
jgi:hypothetical protein